MRTTVSLLIIALTVCCVSTQNFSSIRFARGLVDGIASAKGWQDITNCLKSNDDFTFGIADAVTSYNPTNPLASTIKLGRALQTFPALVRYCNSSITISKNTYDALNSLVTLSNYTNIFIKNLKLFGFDLAKGTIQGYQAIRNGDMRKLGFKVGYAMGQVFLNGTDKPLPVPDVNVTKPNTLIAVGFVRGVLSDLNWVEVDGCIRDTLRSQSDLAKTIQLLQDSTSDSFVQGVSALGVALVDIPSAIQQCTGAMDKAKKLFDAFGAIPDLKTYLKTLGYNLIDNGIDIFEEIHSAAADLEYGAYTEFGFNLGTAFTKLFVENV